jgi:hypothetical protein
MYPRADEVNTSHVLQFERGRPFDNLFLRKASEAMRDKLKNCPLPFVVPQTRLLAIALWRPAQ